MTLILMLLNAEGIYSKKTEPEKNLERNDKSVPVVSRRLM